MYPQKTLRTLHLYGELAKTYGKTHRVFAATFRDALRIVNCNYPDFLRRVARGNFHCLYGDKTLKRSREMFPHHCDLPLNKGDFHMVPVAGGASSGGKSTGKVIFSIVVGGALLATGVGGALGAFGGAAVGFGGTALSVAGASLTYGTVALMGAGLLLGGLSMLLAPVPKTNSSNSNPTTFTFGGPDNSIDEGSPLPLVYGEIIAGSMCVASDLRNNVTGTGTVTGVGNTGSSGGTQSSSDGNGNQIPPSGNGTTGTTVSNTGGVGGGSPFGFADGGPMSHEQSF